MPSLRSLRPALAVAVAAALAGCERHAIPAHVSAAEAAKAESDSDPAHWLTGGKRVFFDDFERAELGPTWVQQRLPAEAEPGDWRIEGGWVRSDKPKNQGVFAKIVPTDGPVRIEFLAKSLKPTTGKFVGDLKAEAFNTAAEHETGYSFINGGWSNSLDEIAKLGEHTADDKRVPAKQLEPDKVYRYAIVRGEGHLYFFRDGDLLYTFDDADPIRGEWFGLNNWLTRAAFDEVAVYQLDAPAEPAAP